MYLPISEQKHTRKSRSKRNTAKHKARQRRRTNRMHGRRLSRAGRK